MERKRGTGMVFINCMEKLTMNSPKDTLRVLLRSAMDLGIDGISVSPIDGVHFDEAAHTALGQAVAAAVQALQ